MTEMILMTHVLFGVGCMLAALWVFVDVLSASEANVGRIRAVSWAAAAFMWVAFVVGGYWYVTFYKVDKAIILKGPWPFAHGKVMETKEHLFFVTLILALLLPIVVREPLYSNAAARKMVLSVAGLIGLTGLALEGAGAVIDHGVKVALLKR